MKKALVILVLMLVVSSVAFGASTRWNALGGEHRFIIDTTNYTIYPGRVTIFGNALFVIPVPKADVKEFYDLRYFTDDGFVAGALLNVSKSMTLAVHYNLDTAGTTNLRKALAGFSYDAQELADAQRTIAREEAGSDDWVADKKTITALSQKSRLYNLDIRTFPDIFWGMKAGKMSFGARLAVAMDNSSDSASTIEDAVMSDSGAALGKNVTLAQEMKSSAMSIDFQAGATMYETPAGDLDLGIGIGIQSFSDDDPNSGMTIESTGGMDVAFNARLNKALDKDGKYMLIPVLGFNTGSNPSAKYDAKSAPSVNEVSYMKGDLGFGIREKVKEKGLVVVGLVGGYGTTTSKPTTTITGEDGTSTSKSLLETTDTTMNATVLAGCEYPITKWLIIRGGANMKFTALTDEMIVQDKTLTYVEGEKDVINDVLGSKKSTGVSFYYNMGIRTIYNGLILDFLLSRNILHRGPFILSGADGIWASHICVTYAF
jgi:hypothetical protein